MIHTLMALHKVKSACQPHHHEAHFQGFCWTSEGPKCPKMGSKWAHFTRLCTPYGVG